MGFDWSTAQEVPQGSVVEGPSGEALQLPPNTNAQNAYGNLPAIEEEKVPVTKAQITPDNKTPSTFDWSSAKELTIPLEKTSSTISLPQATPQELAKVGEKPANVFEQALNQYPVLKTANPVGLISTNTPDGENMLESWKVGEEGTKERPRPMAFPKDQLGVQIFSPKTTADDVAADIVSHHLVNTDPILKDTYNQFASSVTADQKNFLMGDYENEVKQATLSGKEKPPAFDQWLQQTGIPSAFRGYAFNQYKPEDQKEFGYTDQQKQLLGGVKTYLRGENLNQISKQINQATVPYPIKSPKDIGNQMDDYFKNNPQVAGMAWGAGLNGSDKNDPRSVIVNPYNQYMKDPANRQGLIQNEVIRHKMDESSYSPDLKLTPEQQQFRKSLGAYAQDDNAFKQTLIARILTGDAMIDPVSNKSVKPTQEQIAEAQRFKQSISQQQNQTAPNAIQNYLTGVAGKGISNIVDPLITGLKFGRDILSQPKDQPYDWKGAGLAAGSTVLEQAPGLMLGEKVAPLVTEATSPFITPIGGAALGMTSMLATQQATAFGIQKLEGLVGLRDQIQQAQQAHPYVTEGSADLVMAPMAIKSLGNIGSTFAKTLDAKGATAAATEIAKNITGGALGGTLLGPLRYGLESLEYGTGITKEKPTPITGSEELQNGIIGAILHGYHSQQQTDAKLGGPAPELTPSSNELVNSKQKSIEDIAGGLSEDATNTLNLVQSGTPASAFAPKTLAEAKAEIDKALEPDKPAEAPVAEAQHTIKWDNKDGIGSVPDNQDIDYFGFVKPMSAEEFKSIAAPTALREESISGIKKKIESGEGVGSPFLEAKWDNDAKVWRVSGHEGRHRTEAVSQINPNETIPVHIFTKGGMRGKDVTEEMKNAPFIPEKGGEPIKIKLTEEPKNAIQEQTTREVGVRNAPAVGEGVGRQNEAEVPTQEGEEKPEEEVATGENLLPEDKSFVRNLANQARDDIKNFGPGAANIGEFKQSRTAIGASAILEGKTDRAEWNAAMSDEGFNEETMSKSELNQLWRDSNNFVKDFEDSQLGGKEKPKAAIQRTTEGGVEGKVSMTERQALKYQMRTEEKGFKRGTKEAWSQAKEIIGDLKDQISNSITKAQAFAYGLKKMSEGAKIGAADVRRNVKIADRWLAADQDRIRQNLIDLVKTTLPPEERGRFLNRITKAIERPSVLGGDISKMYDREAKLTGVILRHADDVYKKGIINDIKDIFDKAIKAKNIDVRYKGLIKDFFKGLEFTGMTSKKMEELTKRKADLDEAISQGKGSGLSAEATKELERLGRLPLKDMPIGALEQLKEQVQRVFDEGKSALAITKEEQADQKAQLIEQMKASPSNPWNKKTGKFADADQVEKYEMIRNLNNKIIAVQNQLGTLDIAALPTDAAIEWLDGNKGDYTGFLQKNFNGGIDLGYNGYSAEGNAIRENISNIAQEEKINLSGNVMGKISIYANLQQESGRERMIESGSTSPESIDRVEKSGLTSGEMRLYQAMRGHFEKLAPQIREIMRQLYNIEMGEIENYWPMPRDWEKFNELRQKQIAPDPVTGDIYDERSVVDQFLFSTNQPQRTTTKVEQGLTISRVKGAETPIKLSAFNDFNTAIDNMLFIKHLQPVLKQLGEIARTDEFNEKYGTAGQKYILDWMDTVARKGTGVNTIALLDGLRKNISAGVIGFRPSSQLKHTAFIPYAMYHTGGAQWYVRGLFAARTKEGQALVKTAASEISGRSGSDLSVSELQGGKGLIGGIRSKYSKYAFALVRAIDHENSSATFLGRYMYELHQRGYDWSNFDKYPIHIDAQKAALVRMRRAVASPGYKDIPLVLSRGLGVGGSTSIAKTIFQFQNPQLDQWSNVRVDLLGALQNKQYGRAFGLGTAIATSSAIEAGVHVGVGAATALIGGGILGMLTGKSPAPQKKEKDVTEEVAKEFAKNFLTKMPLTPQLWNVLEYHQFNESGIPIVDFPITTLGEVAKTFTSKSEEARKGHAIQATGDIITGVTGLPGSQTITSGIKQLAVDPELQKKEAAQVAKETRQERAKTRTTTPRTIRPIGGIKPIQTIR